MPDLTFSRATRLDVPKLVTLLADDILGATREASGSNNLTRYEAAFAEIDADPNQYLCAVREGDELVGTFQLTFIAGLSRNGSTRGLIEAVRVSADHRGKRIGEAMFEWAIDKCRERGCTILQLTTDKSRTDAHRFYGRLGFEASHIGYKLML